MKKPEIPDTAEGTCHFCGGPSAYHGRREDGSGPTSQYYPACEECARKPYPPKKQLGSTKP
jgi:hypothetical protein